mmetsp:Transcript_1438/g.3675  ORF Transcript_1438/g.3675 Transcript_1438/m.3675 type:complete len:284 (-) Transcript_1438:286-1137(-)
MVIPCSSHNRSIRLRVRSQAGYSWSATKSYQWHSAPSFMWRSKTLKNASPPSPDPKSPSSLPSLGRGARIRSNRRSRDGSTSRTSPCRISRRWAAPVVLTALLFPSIRCPRRAHSTATSLSSIATTDEASVLPEIWIASIPTPAKHTNTSSPRATCWQIRNRSWAMRGLKKQWLRSTTHRMPNSVWDVISGDRWAPAMMTRPSSPGARSVPSRLDCRATTTLMDLFFFMIALPMASGSPSSGMEWRYAMSPITSNDLGMIRLPLPLPLPLPSLVLPTKCALSP